MALLVYLPMTQDLNNKGSSNVTITNTGVTLADNQSRYGRMKCGYFNGSSRIQTTLPTELTTIKNTTVAAWVKSTSSTLALGGISHNSTPNYYDCSCTLYSSGWQTGDLNAGTWRYVSGGSIANTNIWHHVACTISDTNVITYLDGIQVATKTLADWGMTSFALNSTQHFIEIGSDYPGGDEFMTGYVNDFRIYNECLSAQKVAQLAGKDSPGLKLWLPLNGDLRNQGNTNVTIINNGATVDNNGKIGKCYYFNRSTPNYLKITNPFISSANGMTMAFWVKLPANGSINDQLVHIGNGSGWTNNRFNCFVRAGQSTIVCVCGDGTNSTQYTCISSALTLNQWTHVGYTYKDGKVKIYLNGVLDKEYNVSVVPQFADISYIGIGAGPNTTEPSTCYLNDVRIYDSCLSPEQIKWLSKGLVLHYRLDNNGWGNPNLLKAKPFSGGARWTSDRDGRGVKIDWTSNAGDTYFYLNLANGVTLTEGKTYTLSFWCSGVGNSPISFYWCNLAGNSTMGTRFKNGFNSFTFTMPSTNIANPFFDDYERDGSLNNLQLWNFKLEEGSKATAWSPSVADGIAGITVTKEHDGSGFGYDGEKKGVLTYTSDTPKYNASTYFTDGGCIQSNYPGAVGTENFTAAMWIKMPLSTGKSYQPIFTSKGTSANSKGFGLYYNHSQNKFLWSTADGSSAVEIWMNDTISIYDTWTHVVMVRDSADPKHGCIYINGIRKELQSIPSILNINGNTGNLCVGMMPSDYASYRYIGGMSDFRIYATALSASDVLALYNNTAALDTSTNPITIYGKIRN